MEVSGRVCAWMALRVLHLSGWRNGHMADTNWVMGCAPLVIAIADGGRFTKDIPEIDS